MKIAKKVTDEEFRDLIYPNQKYKPKLNSRNLVRFIKEELRVEPSKEEIENWQSIFNSHGMPL